MHLLTVAPAHPALDGHFPGRPVLPGAVLLDEVLARCARELALDPRGWQLESAKFLSAAGPGAELTLELAASAARLQLTVHAAGKPALRALLRRRDAP